MSKLFTSQQKLGMVGAGSIEIQAKPEQGYLSVGLGSGSGESTTDAKVNMSKQEVKRFVLAMIAASEALGWDKE